MLRAQRLSSAAPSDSEGILAEGEYVGCSDWLGTFASETELGLDCIKQAWHAESKGE